jgi:hypothetical protein
MRADVCRSSQLGSGVNIERAESDFFQDVVELLTGEAQLFGHS